MCIFGDGLICCMDMRSDNELSCLFSVIFVDNIACPLASSFGDLVTLVILAAVSVFLQKYISKYFRKSPCIPLHLLTTLLSNDRKCL